MIKHRIYIFEILLTSERDYVIFFWYWWKLRKNALISLSLISVMPEGLKLIVLPVSRDKPNIVPTEDGWIAFPIFFTVFLGAKKQWVVLEVILLGQLLGLSSYTVSVLGSSRTLHTYKGVLFSLSVSWPDCSVTVSIKCSFRLTQVNSCCPPLTRCVWREEPVSQ